MRQHISPFSFLLSSFPLRSGLNLSKHRGEAQFDNTEEGFTKDTATHLARTQFAVDEDYGYLLNLEALLVGGELHFNLEGITLEADGVEVNRFEHLAAVALKPSRCVMNRNARNALHVL